MHKIKYSKLSINIWFCIIIILIAYSPTVFQSTCHTVATFRIVCYLLSILIGGIWQLSPLHHKIQVGFHWKQYDFGISRIAIHTNDFVDQVRRYQHYWINNSFSNSHVLQDFVIKNNSHVLVLWNYTNCNLRVFILSLVQSLI